MSALDRMRAICLALPNTTEGSHFGAVAFKVGTKLFATYHGGTDEHIVFGLEPDHADALVQNDARFTRYARDPNALEIRVARITDWRELRGLLEESYALRAKAEPRKANAKPKAKASIKPKKKLPPRTPGARR
jgi:predicted DNA-binding protein (MmcQ/YjbR family)